MYWTPGSLPALWPFSTLGWPEKTEDLEVFLSHRRSGDGLRYHLLLGCAHGLFSGWKHMGEVPFKYVYVHGLVRDAQGRKMSKSLGNGIDPLEIIDQYGADALRFMLTTGITPGNDMRFKDGQAGKLQKLCQQAVERFQIRN